MDEGCPDERQNFEDERNDSALLPSVFPILVNTHFLIHVSFTNRRLLETHYLLLGVFGKHWEVNFGAFLTCKTRRFDSMM